MESPVRFFFLFLLAYFAKIHYHRGSLRKEEYTIMEFDFRQFIEDLKKKKWLVLILFIMGLVISFLTASM